MKKLIYLILFALIATPVLSNPQDQVLKTDTAKIKVYYFHNARRCLTCNAVEKVTLETLKESYSDQLNSEKIVFKSLNIEESQELANSLNVSGSTLILVKNDKKVNLTNTAFMNARNKPEKLAKKIKEIIDNLLSE